jgi:hypothetical protein
MSDASELDDEIVGETPENTDGAPETPTVEVEDTMPPVVA